VIELLTLALHIFFVFFDFAHYRVASRGLHSALVCYPLNEIRARLSAVAKKQINHTRYRYREALMGLNAEPIFHCTIICFLMRFQSFSAQNYLLLHGYYISLNALVGKLTNASQSGPIISLYYI